MKWILSFALTLAVGVALIVLGLTVNQWFLLLYLLIGATVVKFYWEGPFDPAAELWYGLIWPLPASWLIIMHLAAPFKKLAPLRIHQPTH